jgi:hypothetical protein
MELRHFFNEEIVFPRPKFPVRIFLLNRPANGRKTSMICQTIE